MECSDFLSAFTDYRDGLADPARLRRLERHRQSCPSCRRYCRTLDEGVRLLRSRSPAPVSEDFRPRLQHRIYHVEDDDAIAPPGGSSGVAPVAAVSMAILLALAAWSPVLLRPEPEVRLPALVVNRPAAPPAEPGLAPPPLFEPAVSSERAVRWDPGPRWERPTALLLQYSPLLERSRTAGRDRTDLD